VHWLSFAQKPCSGFSRPLPKCFPSIKRGGIPWYGEVRNQNPLFGIQFDDEMFLDRHGDIFPGRQQPDIPRKFSLSTSSHWGTPRRSTAFKDSTICGNLPAFFLDFDDIAHIYQQRGDIDLIAIEEKMLMADQLPGLGPGDGKTQADK
jgi:hypothetical protein